MTKERYVAFLFSFVATLLVLEPGLLSPVFSEQILRNSGFEEGTTEQPSAWAVNGSVSRCEPSRSGRYSVELGNKSSIHQCFSLETGLLYHGSVWARGSGKLTLSFYEYKDGPGQNYASAVSSEVIDVTPEWQQFHLTYSKGPNEAHLKGLCFALSASGEKAKILVDDTSVEMTPIHTPPLNLLSNSDFVEVNTEGLPSHWQGEKRRLKLETSPKGIKSIRCDASLFSEDYQPPPDFHDWWNWNRWGEQHGSGWPALPRPLGGAYTVLFESEPVPIEPGRRYDVVMLLRHLEVYGEFIAVRWFNAEKKPLAEFEERIGYYHFQGHTSDWVQYVGRVTSSQAARYAAVVVGAKLSSGSIWVAQPSLTAASGAPGRQEPRSEWLPTTLKQGQPKPDDTLHKAIQVPSLQKSGLVVEPERITISFAEGLFLEMPLRNKRLVGVTTVSIGKTYLRNPKAPPLSPVIETRASRAYVDCLYDNWEKTADGFVIHSSLRTADGKSDQLDWLFSFTSQHFAGRRYSGLRYSYHFKSKEVRVKRIMDRATWELGGRPLGVRVTRDHQPLSRSSTYCIDCAYRFVESDSFDYQTCASGTLISFLDHYQTTLLTRGSTHDFLLLQDTFLFPEVTEASTTMKYVLFSPEQSSPDDWAQLRDVIYERFRRQLGAPPERPLEPAAMILGWSGFKGVGDLQTNATYEDRSAYYRWVADKAIPRLAKLGFKRVMIVLGMAPWNWSGKDINDLGPDYVIAFKYLCDAAHRQGITVISWYGTAQNLDQAPVWKEHPEYILMGSDGQRTRTYFSPWGWPGKLAAGFNSYTLERLKSIRERTGLDGLWLDSYSFASHLLDTAVFKDCVDQADALLPWQAQIEKMGYYTYCEGDPRCIGYPSTSGWQPPDDWSRFRPEIYYKQGLYLQQAYVTTDMGRFLADPEKRHYYRMLANRCCPILDMGNFGNDKAAIELIGQVNHDFNAVCDLMKTRKLIGNRGVEWSARTGKAVFAFEVINYAVSKGSKLKDITTGKQITLPANHRVILEPYHTYRITP